MPTEKAALRRTMLDRRKGMASTAPAFAQQLETARFTPRATTTIAAYMPSGSEIDPHPIMAHFTAAGHHLCLPVCKAEGAPLVFRQHTLGAACVADAAGMQAPPPHAAACVPRLVFVPLLAFDEAGYRLGRGGGHYDRTLPGLSATAVGVAYDAQKVETCPRDPHDYRLDYVLTPSRIYDFTTPA